jgi:hypothetical protein
MLELPKDKLEAVIDLVDKLSVNPDIEVKYFLPGVLITTQKDSLSDNPYIELEYLVDGVDKHMQHITLSKTYLDKTPQDLANLITFSAEQFIAEIDSRQYGAQ